MKERAPRNRTVLVQPVERERLQQRLRTLSGPTDVAAIENSTINQDLFEVLDWFPASFVDLLFLDPPYNLTKAFHGTAFKQVSLDDYKAWLESWFPKLVRTLKPHASVYVCSDWRSSAAVYVVAQKYLTVRNRITWEREKGRGASANWKNCSEDIWFCTRSGTYTFNLEAVKVRRRVIAPYRSKDGQPKQWERGENGDFRFTHPSNMWTDLTVPFWSMPENTDHPTQKPEKLLAKVILASSNPEDTVLDPFLGSGTSSVVAKKLGRKYVGIEKSKEYCLLAEKRLELAESDGSIQGFANGVFWERNSLPSPKTTSGSAARQERLPLAAREL